MVISGASDASAEFLVQSTWTNIAWLPSKRVYSSAATLNNVVSVFGKKSISFHNYLITLCPGGANYIVNQYVYYDEIFSYNSTLNTWTITGRLMEPRGWHVVAVLDRPDVCQATHSCEADWSMFDGRCYKYFSDKKNWEDAHNQCRTNNVRKYKFHILKSC